jgi:hypothetical protein
MLGSASQFISIMLATLPHMQRVTPHYSFQSAPLKVKGAIEKLIAETMEGHEKHSDETVKTVKDTDAS